MSDHIKVQIDFSNVALGTNYYAIIGESFSFMDGFGENWHGAYDCLRSARSFEEGMVKAPLSIDQQYLARIKGLSKLTKDYAMSGYSIIKLIEEVNRFHIEKFGISLIIVEFA